MNALIFHNPSCSTSREVLRILKAAGAEVTVVEYLKTGWTEPLLAALLTVADLSPKQALRLREAKAKAPELLAEDAEDAAIIAAMLANPALIERPIVCTANGVRLCRPLGRVLEILDPWPDAPFTLSNGKLLIDADGAAVSGR